MRLVFLPLKLAISESRLVNLTGDQAVALARKIIAFYQEQGKFPERMGATIERAGFDTLVKGVT